MSVLSLFVAGCSPCERLARLCPPQASKSEKEYIHDTLIREVHITDTLMLVKLVQETVRESVPIEDTARAETEYAEAEAYVNGGNIHLTLSNKDSAEVLVKRIETLERELHKAYKELQENSVQIVYQTRGIVKVFMWIGIIAVAYVVVRFLLFVLRKL